MAKASSSGEMDENMKVAGTKANNMVKVSTLTNMVSNVLVPGLKERGHAGMTNHLHNRSDMSLLDAIVKSSVLLRSI